MVRELTQEEIEYVSGGCEDKNGRQCEEDNSGQVDEIIVSASGPTGSSGFVDVGTGGVTGSRGARGGRKKTKTKIEGQIRP